jgi:hypothetical protein
MNMTLYHQIESIRIEHGTLSLIVDGQAISKSIADISPALAGASDQQLAPFEISPRVWHSLAIARRGCLGRWLAGSAPCNPSMEEVSLIDTHPAATAKLPDKVIESLVESDRRKLVGFRDKLAGFEQRHA